MLGNLSRVTLADKEDRSLFAQIVKQYLWLAYTERLLADTNHKSWIIKVFDLYFFSHETIW